MAALHDLSTESWTVRAVGDLTMVPAAVLDRVIAGVPATLLPEVGGCVHTDLMDAGVIADPAAGMNEAAAEWVSWTDWCYECTFEVPPPIDAGPDALGRSGLLDHHQVDLVFACLDTIATIELNDAVLGRTNSEFLPHRFNINAHLRPGTNTLRVTFTSPLRAAYDLAKTLGLPHNGDESSPPWHPFNMMRKCASNFGWDWGPKVATCGIGSVGIEAWSHVRIDGPLRVDRSDGILSVTVPLRWASDHDRPDSMSLSGELEIGTERDGLFPFVETLPLRSFMELSTNVLLQAVVPCVDRGVLDAKMAAGRVKLTFKVQGKAFTEEHELRTGLREVKWSGDAIAINDKPVFIKGVNWIPEGLWPRDRTRAKIRARLLQAKAMGCNLIRVWGGGRYESGAFYEICDELGLMVWQDFMFACACYPEEPPFPDLIEAEARYQVARLSKHPCVVLWCGGNENHWAYESWGFKDRVPPGRGWGTKYWQDLLPKIVAELSPRTPYVPDSPWSPPPTHPNAAEVGDRHTWDLFGDDFRTHVPRFCSEFGVQSPSNLETLREARILPPANGAPTGTNTPLTAAIAPLTGVFAPSTAVIAPLTAVGAPLTGTNGAPTVPFIGGGALEARQRGPGGMKRWYDEFFAKAGLPAPATFEAWQAQAQQLQADWLSLAVVWLRANAPFCGGAIIWQLNDAWPGFSWSLIDSAGREKPAYFAVQRAFADRLVETVPFEGVPHLVAINDTDEVWNAGPSAGLNTDWLVAPRSVAKRPVSDRRPESPSASPPT